MFQGRLLSIFVATGKAGDRQEVTEIEAIPGQGLAGDRYRKAAAEQKPDREITLIEQEALEALNEEYGIALEPRQARRNLLTQGAPLNQLVGKTFKVGSVQLRGVRLCEPCEHLEKLTVKGVRKGLIHRGGLRAQIVSAGTLRVQDLIQPGDS